ncbi:MAG: hypothetical protein GX033_02315 [Firmicutes bacterium]|nr:hypothetical protein [Bacillota bacterium]
MLKHKLTHHLPPGVDLERELAWFEGGIFVSLLYSLRFLIRYANEYQSLFLWNGSEKVLNTNAVMPDFVQILGGSLSGFLVLALCMAATAAYHYSYHFQGSKSIYLMKRLPNRWELPRRCLTLPVLGIITCLCIALLLLLIYYAVYMLFTPRACLAPQQWHKIWSVLRGVGR